MLTPEGCRARRDRLWAALDPRPDWILLAEPMHLTWACGYYASPFTFRTQNAPAMLLLGADGSSSLFVDNLLKPLADQAYVDSVVIPVWYRGIQSAQIRSNHLCRTVNDHLSKCSGMKMGIDGAVSAGLVDNLRTICDVSGVIHSLRRRKDPDEISEMRAAIQATEAGFAAAYREIRRGNTELQAFEVVQRAATEAAGIPVQIYGDFASGQRTVEGGGPPTGRVIEAGDLILLDYSVIVNGYRGDFANTWVVDGTPTREQRRLEAGCLEALATGEAMLRPRIACREIDAAMRAVYRNHGLDEGIGHHLGHGVGLGHPDPPYIVPESEDTLLAGDIVTLEPGQYVSGVGGVRFERNYLITESGSDLLTHHAIGLDAAKS